LAAGIICIVIALAIGGFFVWRHFSVVVGNQRLATAAGVDGELLDAYAVDGDGDLPNIDWAALKAVNSDIVGWLYVPKTPLSHPIVRGADNDYYLNHTADGSWNPSGAIFLDYQNSPNFTDISNYIYGHNMLGNAMFSEFTKYTDPSFFTDHPWVIILTPEKIYRLHVRAAIECKGSEEVRRLSFASDGDFHDFKAFLGGFLKSGQYDSLLESTNLYCFSTCKFMDTSARVIVIATDENAPKALLPTPYA